MSFTRTLIYNRSTLHMIFIVHIQLRGHINLCTTQYYKNPRILNVTAFTLSVTRDWVYSILNKERVDLKIILSQPELIEAKEEK